jgi:hypothetical protein
MRGSGDWMDRMVLGRGGLGGMSGDEDVRVEVAELIVFLHRGGIRGGGGCEAVAAGWTGWC